MLAFQAGRGVQLVAETSQDRWEGPSVTALGVDPNGTLLYGTSDAKIHRIANDGNQPDPLLLPYRKIGFLFAFSAATSITPGPAGGILVRTREGPVAFDNEGQVLWSSPQPCLRGGANFPVLASPDGSLVYDTGGRSVVALEADTGEVAWEYPIRLEEGDCFNAGLVDEDGNLYTVTGEGVVLKFSPEGEVLWRRQGPPRKKTSSPQVEGRLEFDAWGNVCVNPSTRSFQVYDPDGVALLKLETEDPFGGSPYIFDFAVSEDGEKAFIFTVGQFEGQRRNTLVELALPGSSDELRQELTNQEPETIQLRLKEEHLVIDGISLPIEQW